VGRHAALGWHLELHTDRGGLPTALAVLPRELPLVIDHLGKPAAVALRDPTVSTLLRQAHRVHEAQRRRPQPRTRCGCAGPAMARRARPRSPAVGQRLAVNPAALDWAR
jgi:hypothetical protein